MCPILEYLEAPGTRSSWMGSGGSALAAADYPVIEVGPVYQILQSVKLAGVQDITENIDTVRYGQKR